MTSLPKSVCVYCGSRSGNDPAYAALATGTGEMLARNNWTLVYGAGDVGLMGLVAEGTQNNGGDAFGVIPTHLMKREIGRRSLNRMVITETMHERKKVMFMNSDAVVVLPGGAGTMDEYFEVLTWRQIGLHEKPIYVLNINGFWDPLFAMLENFVQTGFAESSLLSFTKSARTVEELEAMLQADFAE